jgi:predicted Zn-dependent protease
VAQHPDNVMFRFSLGQALVEEGRAADALDHLRHCCAQKSDWMMARILLGKALVALGRAPEALPILEDALKLAIDQRHEAPEAELRALLADLKRARSA